MTPGAFTEVLLTAPVGVALLQGLEAEQRPDVGFFNRIVGSRPDAVAAAAAAVETMTTGLLLGSVLSYADSFAGPWNPTALVDLPEAYRCAPDRRVVAEAVAERFVSDLSGSIDRSAQEWWCVRDLSMPVLPERAGVYCCGEWPWRRVWTVTAPPEESHQDLVCAWELWGGELGRWNVGIDDSARVFEIDQPDDWRRLVSAYPKEATLRHSGWELPGVNQQRDHAEGLIEPVVASSGGRAARLGVRVLMPDWERVAQDWDGVHLSWAGMIGCEGHVVDLPEFGDRAVTMLRYWASERTLWFRSAPMASATGMSAPIASENVQVTSVSTIGMPVPDFARWPI